ncbi:hypothetical protein CBER1_06285 [Cercospora berteroae]|uniref:Uncharacterized protein n=1 Tax=Cercospora berteroae TaxID=357750 RepID=A0A2S6BSW6_9PEZI|nr:hypothetical protein CBER1_06285 [Cercospora berteroae]
MAFSASASTHGKSLQDHSSDTVPAYAAAVESPEGGKQHQQSLEAANTLLALASSGNAPHKAPPQYDRNISWTKYMFVPLDPAGTKIHAIGITGDIEPAIVIPPVPASMRPGDPYLDVPIDLPGTKKRPIDFSGDMESERVAPPIRALMRPAGPYQFKPLDLPGTQNRPIDLSGEVEPQIVAPRMPVSMLAAGQDLSSWDNEFLMAKHSMSQSFKVDSIHPDDLGGKLFAILKTSPHTEPTHKIVAATRDCYTRRNLPLATGNAIKKRIKDAFTFWAPKLSDPAVSSVEPYQPPPYAPPSYISPAPPQLVAPPRQADAPLFLATPFRMESQICELKAVNASLMLRDRNWAAAYHDQPNEVQRLRAELAAAREQLVAVARQA